jgi:hypothetical protein
LANTQAVSPELANRREIPLSAFDFLNGAYNATKRARRITLTVIAAVLLLTIYVGAGAFVNSFKAGDVEARLKDLEAERSALIAEFGSEIDGIPTQVVLDRDRSLSSGLAAVTAAQGDVISILNEISGLVSGRVTVVRVTYGLTADAKSKTTTTTLAPGQQAPKEADSVAFSIVVRGSDIAVAAEAADRIRQLPSLQNVDVDVQGREVIVTSSIPLNKPPRAMLERLIGLGVRASSSSGVSADADEEASTPADTTTTTPTEGDN